MYKSLRIEGNYSFYVNLDTNPKKYSNSQGIRNLNIQTSPKMFSEFSDNQNFVYVREVSQKEKRDMKTAF